MCKERNYGSMSFEALYWRRSIHFSRLDGILRNPQERSKYNFQLPSDIQGMQRNVHKTNFEQIQQAIAQKRGS